MENGTVNCPRTMGVSSGAICVASRLRVIHGIYNCRAIGENQVEANAEGSSRRCPDKSANRLAGHHPADRSPTDLYWQSIKFRRPIYIDWLIHRIEAVVNKCTVVHAAPRISPFTTESAGKKKERWNGGRGGGERKEARKKGEETKESGKRWSRGVVISAQIARGEDPVETKGTVDTTVAGVWNARGAVARKRKGGGAGPGCGGKNIKKRKTTG